ncbi:MAG TPA: zinc-dependent alcohol dehydrogenase family protein, partial [Bryobacteraceae bacterium]|nr:zinc-dependent alcohol dehydrogenase family protein [Bryobacteraceae bacterium]
MKACILRSPAPIEKNPLEFTDVPKPEPGAGQVLVRVNACAVCRTDLHVIEGELTPRKTPITPGHQVVGIVEAAGAGAKLYPIGTRVGIAWLHSTDGTCEYCKAGRENLCDHPSFTGYTVDGGYAEYALAEESFVYPIPEGFRDLAAAPLLCAGIIGFRCLRIADIERGGRLGLYGFGAAAHVAIQVARHWGAEVYACTRDQRHQKLALELGAVWAGGTVDPPPVKLDSAIVFAPAGEIVPAALKALKRAGALVLGGIHMSTIPPLDYDLLYEERVVR